MASSVRRPLPALIALVALLVLTGLVWWRVLDRSDGSATPSAGATCSSTARPSPTGSATSTPAAPVTTLPTPSSVTLQVLNSTTRAGIAGKARAALVKEGFKAPGAAGNDVKYAGKIAYAAQIRYTAAEKNAARLVHYYLPGSRIIAVSGSSRTVVVSLGKAYRSVASTAAVRKELAAAHASASPAPQSSQASASSSAC